MRSVNLLRLCVLASLLLLVGCAGEKTFEGERAYNHVEAQCDFGFRPTGSPAGIATGDYIIAQLESFGWEVEEQEFDYLGVGVRNLIARHPAHTTDAPVIMVGAHYDTRRSANRDDPTVPVLGANDGASGVAVLLELARVLDTDLERQVWLVFFDAEDNGGLDGWEWCVGSSYMAANLTTVPEAVIVVDMVGDADQQFYLEYNSNPILQRRLWDVAAELGYGQNFIPEYRHSIYDDHVPFAQRGIVAVDIIDFDYPYWHTTEDTVDKVSAESLERIGRVLEQYLELGVAQ